MPPALEVIDLSDDDDLELGHQTPAIRPTAKSAPRALFPVINRNGINPGRQYPDGPLPIRPSTDAPLKARITGRVADDNGVFYTLMVGETKIDEVVLAEVLDYVSAYDLEEFENAQFIEEEENRKIAKAAEEAEQEARRLRRQEKLRKKGLILVEEPEDRPDSNDEGEVAVGRHGRARPTYTHLYKIPGGGKNGGVRRRRKRDPSTGELLPLSDEEEGHAVGSSADERDVRKTVGRSDASRSSVLASGLELPRRRRRKRDPATGELMPLSGDDNVESSDGGLVLQPLARSTPVLTMEAQARSSVAPKGESSASSNPTQTKMEPRAASSPMRRPAPNVTMELPKRRRRKRDPRTGELLPLDPDPINVQFSRSVRSVSTRQVGEKPKRPRRRRHPITGELMPLGWVYNPNSEGASFEAAAEVRSMHKLSLTRDTKRVKLTSEPSSHEDSQMAQPAISPHARAENVSTAAHMESSAEDSDESSSMQLSVLDSAPTPAKAAIQVRSPNNVRSPKHGMMQRAPASSSSSHNEPITLASFLSTTASGKKADEEDSSEDDSSSESAANIAVAPAKTSMMRPVASQQQEDSSEEDENSELDEGEFFVEGIRAHHLSDPRTHPGKEQVMLYQTKWQGFEELTWEPAASFGDENVVLEYRKRVGLD